MSFSGRIRRKTWWIYVVIATIVYLGAYMIAASMIESSVYNIDLSTYNNLATSADITAYFNDATQLPANAKLVLYGTSAVMGLIGLSFNVRRWHDLDKSGWWVLIGAIPVIGWLYAFFALGFAEGTRGSNHYGPDPKGGNQPVYQAR